MGLVLAFLLLLTGGAIVILCGRRVAAGAIASAMGLGLSPLMTSVLMVGFVPETLLIALVASLAAVEGIAIGVIVGGVMAAMALSMGLGVIRKEMTFAAAPAATLIVPVLAVLLFWGLAADGELARVDGLALLMAFGTAAVFLLYLSRKGLEVKPAGDAAAAGDEKLPLSALQSMGLLGLLVAGLAAGAIMLVYGVGYATAAAKVSNTTVAMTLLALLPAAPRLWRQTPAGEAAPKITYGNIMAPIIAGFLLIGGVVAIISPFKVPPAAVSFYLPLCVLTVAFVASVLLFRKLPRWSGAVLLALFAWFVLGGWIFHFAQNRS
ncbi:MAG: hypothetical protein ABFD92_09140 [Planctomycetaceae bacterium]|nr:hypothetical protein [Planctomycetaceae bacterium]